MPFAIYFPKAPDRVDHYILLMKLRQFGLGGFLLKVIASYLQNRVQQNKVGNYRSDELFITRGVPKPQCLATFPSYFP